MTANTNYPDNITALYARLSQEDAEDALCGSGKGQNGYRQGYVLILSRLVDTFFSRISLTMPPALLPEKTAPPIFSLPSL